MNRASASSSTPASRPTDPLLASRVLDYFRQRYAGEGIPVERITLEAHLERDLGADSLDLVDMVMELEDRFGISLEHNQAEGIQTVGDAVDLVVAQVNAQRG